MGNRVFNFRERHINVNIAGNEFVFEYSDNIGDQLDGFSKKLIRISAEIREGKKTNADALKVCGEMLDVLLGDGANEKIFLERKPSLLDYTDIFLFLTDEVRAVNKTTANRAQRRAKGL